MSDTLFSKGKPAFEIRAVHMDLKGLPPTPQRFLEQLEIYASARYNTVVMEWEDTFPWQVDERFRSPTCYSRDDIKRFIEKAEKLNLQLIPLVQCLGHMENTLAIDDYKHLRELPYYSDCLNPLATGAGELVGKLIDDVCELMPNIKYFHLGGDEARNIGKAENTRQYIQQHGKDRLYLQHVEPLLEKLNSSGIRPILWHDMMIHWSDDALGQLAKKADLCVWGYYGDPEVTTEHYNVKYIQRFKDAGLNLWTATAYKGANGCCADLADIQAREDNTMAWVRVSQQFKIKNIIATGWSRYTKTRVQTIPADAALDSLINVAAIIYNGEPPSGGRCACLELLDRISEKERFQSCYTAMKKLTQVRGRGWEFAQNLRHQLALLKLYPQRKDSPVILVTDLKDIFKALEEAKQLRGRIEKAFAGLVERIWIDEYMDVRIESLQDEFDRLKELVKKQAPQAFNEQLEQ